MESAERNWTFAGIGLVFVLFGCHAFWSITGKMLSGYIESADWIAQPVRIVELEIAKNGGDDTSTYLIVGSYTFQFNGMKYFNDRISISSDGDRLGRFLPELYQNLQTLRDANEVIVFVDSDNPNNAVLDRTWRWESFLFACLFLFIFCGSGGFVAWYSLNKYKRPKELRISYPHKGSFYVNEDIDHVPITVTSNYVSLIRKGYRNPSVNLGVILMGALFFALGTYILRAHPIGYFIVLLGLSALTASIFGFGKTTKVIVDKQTRMLFKIHHWMGWPIYQQEIEIQEANDIYIKCTSSTITQINHKKTITYYYKVYINRGGIELDIANDITDRRAAVALKDTIIEHCFIEPQRSMAA